METFYNFAQKTWFSHMIFHIVSLSKKQYFWPTNVKLQTQKQMNSKMIVCSENFQFSGQISYKWRLLKARAWNYNADYK